MEKKYIVGIDQSTQGTKAILFNEKGIRIARNDLSHEQIVNENGWVEHNPMEIYENTIKVIKNVVAKANIAKEDIQVIGISNQRETIVVWDRTTGEPIYNAIVWQCARGAAICDRIEKGGHGQLIREHTGLQLSPYFSAAKIAWILENISGAKEKAEKGELCCATMDSWLVYKLTHGKEFRTDYSNASRTQLFHIERLEWDKEVCALFDIPICVLPKVTDSNGEFGYTDFEGYLDEPIMIHSVFGDSHGALFGQGCVEKGMVKTTYGTGSSVMMNIGEKPIRSKGVVTSLAWGMNGTVQYVLEGNINYTGAVITWLKDDLQIINSPEETQELAYMANPQDKTYLVPAFSGLGAPYWDSKATASISGITRTTGKAEIVRAGLECIAYQITDIVNAMSEEAEIEIAELRVDGGVTKNSYLMQFQSDMIGIPVQVPNVEELSGIGAAYAAGIAIGIYDQQELFAATHRTRFEPKMIQAKREEKYRGWKTAVGKVLE